ncbi:MAG: phosphate ABC transporter substrate-binding protein [Thermodesulfobacteriota bacterium]
MQKPSRFLTTLATAAALFVAPLSAGAVTEIDPALPSYKVSDGVAGNLNSIGSDTLNNLMTYWAEGFQKKYPNVRIQIEGKGSSTAPPALISGTAQLGPMSRTMKSQETDAFEKQYGFKPTAIGVALDSLAVFVNKDNPVDSLSLEQLDGIFSKTRKSGAQDITTWDQLGVGGPLASRPISLYGRNSASGTYGYFKEHALAKGDFKETVKEQPGSASVVMGVSGDAAGIGYSGIGYLTSGVKTIKLAKAAGGEGFAPTYDNVLAGKYPLSRMLYVYVVKEPGKPMPKMISEFLTFVLSKEGQEIVVKDGYLPLPAKIAEKQLALTK